VRSRKGKKRNATAGQTGSGTRVLHLHCPEEREGGDSFLLPPPSYRIERKEEGVTCLLCQHQTKAGRGGQYLFHAHCQPRRIRMPSIHTGGMSLQESVVSIEL